MQKIKRFVLEHKVWSAIILIVIVYLGYKIVSAYTNTSGETRYVVDAPTRGTLVASVTGTGQVSASNQVDVKSKVSGDIVYVGVKSGDQVYAGTLLAEIDPRGAQNDLESSQIAYDKLVKPADPKDVVNAQDTVAKSYNDVWNAISGTFLDYPAITKGLDALYSGQGGYLNDTGNAFNNNQAARDLNKNGRQEYEKAKTQYEQVLKEYQSLSRTSATASIETLLSDTSQMINYLAETLKSTRNTITFVTENESTYLPNAGATAATDVNTWSNTINSDISSLLTAQNSLTSNKNALAKLLEGADPLDVRSQQLALDQKQQAYNDYFIRAPFDGIVGSVGVQVGDSANNSVIATMITRQKIAEISLNEVDVAKVKVGQKATLTFDAIPDLTITGTVDEVDLIGTVNQGVVTYNVKVGFDTENDQVKPGMSVSAAIITEVKPDVLMVPNGAIKSQGNTNYVEVFNPPLAQTASSTTPGIPSKTPPTEQEVTTGLSNDTDTEIVSGLTGNEQIVTRTITPTTASTNQAPSLFGGNRNAGGGNNRNIRIGG